MAQLKFVVDDALAERFKRAVLRKRGKLALSDEGAHALRLYLDQTPTAPEGRDSLLDSIGAATSKASARPSALKDKQALYG